MLSQKINNELNKKIVRQLFLVFVDAISIAAASFLALWIRFEFEIFSLNETELSYFRNVLHCLPAALIVGIVVFCVMGLYDSLWEFAGEKEAFRVVISALIVSAFHILIQYLFEKPVPRSFVVIELILLAAFVFVTRFSYRFLRKIVSDYKKSGTATIKTMLIGAGDAGAMILHELQRSSNSKNNIVCILDDDITKLGKKMYGVTVVGDTNEIEKYAKKYDIEEIILAIPTLPSAKKRKILNECSNTKCVLKTLPGIYQLVNGEVNIQKIRNVEIEDLLERESIKVNLDEIAYYVSDKTVLVTGGGGSIGSELCRQLATYSPKKLIIFDIYENNAYEIQQELKRTHPALDLEVLIGSVRDKDRVEMLFKTFRPDIVYHAAAHKHVPLMEDSPNESIKNNVFGTWNVADVADKYKAEAFILISTDKAVNPTNIMGASKRLCEKIICDFAARSDTKFACVRFGNVLGSNGSVIHLFKSQIKNGGPVTVTHKNIIRYFMTIPEAVSLVLQAGAYANEGEIFVLDMGEPVKIDDLARNMIKLSGFEPDVDIAIEYTGLRPGEKLYEELLLSGEGLRKTPNELIFIGLLENIDREEFENKLAKLKDACNSNSEDIKTLVKELVPEYKINGH